MFSNVALEELRAVGGLEVDHLDSPLAQPVDSAAESARLADDHGADLKLHYEATAVPARRQGGHHDGVLVGTLASGLAKSIRLAVDGRIVLLDPAVVPPPEKPSRPVKQCGADGNPAFRHPQARFLQRDNEHTFVIRFG